MAEAIKKKLNDLLYAGAAAFIFAFFIAYEIIRAGRVALTFDEAATYFNYIHRDVLSLFDFNVANNHFLNTVLTKLSSVILGNGEIALRLPNLIGYILFLAFSFLLLKKFASRWIALLGFLLMNLNPYLLDFFSLSRGYGLSLDLLAVSLYFFVSCFSKAVKGDDSSLRDLSISLAAAAGAVLANFTLLIVYLSLAAVAALACVIINVTGARRSEYIPAPAKARSGRIGPWAVVALGALVFNLLVISHDLGFSSRLYEPVRVRVFGLTEKEKKAVEVVRLGVRDTESSLSYENGDWSLSDRVHYIGLKLRIPAALGDKFRRVEVQMGARTFSFGPENIKTLRQHPNGQNFVFFIDKEVALKRSVLPAFSPIVNWRGDGVFILEILQKGIPIVGLLALSVIMILALGGWLGRTNFLRTDQLRPLVSVTLTLALFVSYPIYLLKKSGELYWGGRSGFIKDTVTSLIDGSAYGRLYFKGQTQAVSWLILLFVVTFLALLPYHIKKRSAAGVLPRFLVLAVIIVAAGGSILSAVIFKNPYLLGRTALFFIPLTVTFCAFVGQSLAETHKIVRTVVFLLMGAAVLASVVHFSGTANSVMTVEWRSDADDKAVLDDLTAIKNRDMPERTKVRLGIDWIFMPSLRYYVERRGLSWLDTALIPDRRENDFYFIEEQFDPAFMILVKSYPASGNILVKAKPETP